MQNSSHKSTCVLVAETKGTSQPCTDIHVQLLPWLARLQLEPGCYLGFLLKHRASGVLAASEQNEAMFQLPAILNEGLQLSTSSYLLNKNTWRSLSFLCLRMLVPFAQVHPFSSFNLWESSARVWIPRYNLQGCKNCEAFPRNRTPWPFFGPRNM